MIDKKEADRLVAENQGVIKAIAIKFWRQYKWLDIDDVVSEAYLAAVLSSPKFDSERSSYKTYIGMCIMSHLLAYSIKEGRTKGRVIADGGESADVFEAVPPKNTDDARIIEAATSSSLICERMMGKTLQEIADVSGVNRSTIHRREKREIERLRATFAGQ